MKIVVLAKDVPDTYGDRTLNLETGLAERAEGDRVLDESSERALEVALAYADANPDTEVVALTVGPAEAEASVRKALAMGATSAVLVADENLAGSDVGTTTKVLEAALKRVGFDLVIAGNLTTDGMGGVVPAMVAERLGIPNLTGLSAVTVAEASVTGTRLVESGLQSVESSLPAVVSITEALPDPRFPNFKGIMAAKKKTVEVLSLADLSLDLPEFQLPLSIMLTIAERPVRQAGVLITDEAGSSVSQIVEFLQQADAIPGGAK